MSRFGRRGLWLLLLLSAPGLQAIELGLSEPFPLEGEPVELVLVSSSGEPIAGADVTVLYRPNSEALSEELLTSTDAEGKTQWRPARAGLARLVVARDGEELLRHEVAVRWGSFPTSGLVTMVVALFLLFGGAGIGFLLLLRR